MRLGDRSLAGVVRSLAQPRNLRALSRYPSTFEAPLQAFLRYAGTRQAYPWVCRIRTPTGIVEPTLFTYHDLRTVNEIFCRQDYGDGAGVRTVVDIGANIGLATLFFLTRNPDVRVFCFEPDARNLEKLEANLSQFRNRVFVNGLAVTVEGGKVLFKTEETGRYGSVIEETPQDDSGSTIAVDSVSIRSVLEELLEAGPVDLVKIDTEGSEQDLADSISGMMDRIGAVVYEDNRGGVAWLRGKRAAG